MSGSIEHFVVLMMENHSFDHMLGYPSGELDGTQWQPTQYPSGPPTVPVTDDAPDSTQSPGHQLENVNRQLFGVDDPSADTEPNMLGFVDDYRQQQPTPKSDRDPVRCFGAQSAYTPALRALAAAFTLCTRWFSSVPGPTTPNRLFANCASSGGFAGQGYLYDPDGKANILNVPHSLVDLPSIFGRLTAQATRWKAFHEDDNFVSEAVLAEAGPGLQSDPGFSHFLEAISARSLPQYSFLTPSLDPDGDSQHPPSLVSTGDKLIASIYTHLFAASSPYRTNTALLVTYDEHGGYYDHVPPPGGQAYDGRLWDAGTPSDFFFAQSKSPSFDFSRLGVRVPTIVISAYTPAGLDATTYEHSSIVHTTRDLFDIPEPLTVRDQNAASLMPSFSLATPRDDLPDLSALAL